MPAQKRAVALLRSGSCIVVSPTTPQVADAVVPRLKYVERKFAHGADLVHRKRNRLPTFDTVEWECFSRDHKNRIVTSYGFEDRVRAALEDAGYAVSTRWATEALAAAHAARLETVYKPRWDRIEAMAADGFAFRYRQKKCLRVIAGNENGRIDCPPGWGKGTVIMLACVLLPKAKIDVVTKSCSVLTQRLYPELVSNLPSVGIVGGGRREVGHRVMCISADSLHHGRPDADVVLVDEGHQACADKFAEKMGIYEHARVFMFSGSWDMRLDNKDMRAEAMAGPIRLVVSYQEAESRGLVVPITVRWTDVVMTENPCEGLDLDTDKKKYGVWCNDHRNALIAADARAYDDDTQVLITVETLEHALNLKRLLPEYELVYSPRKIKPEDLKWFAKHFPDEFSVMTDKKKVRLTKRFETGRLKKAIATTVWNVGVNFRHLEVLIRADAGGSPINDVQIPGRNSRTNDAVVKRAGTKKKLVGVVHDYRDYFDAGFARKSAGREKNYARYGWAQVNPAPAARRPRGGHTDTRDGSFV